jgi:UDP-N-acetylmuramate dehydrogenase
MQIQKNIKLAPYTTLKIGGLADYFAIAKSQKDLIGALNWAKSKKIPYYILGNGSNVLISDQGFRGLVVKYQVSSIKYQANIVIADAGTPMSLLAKETAKHGLAGLEFGIGIPGTIGGAIYGNAGAFGREIGDVVKAVRVLQPNKLQDLDTASAPSSRLDTRGSRVQILLSNKCMFSYRDSIFKKHKDWIILSAELKLKKDDTQRCQKRIKEMLKDKVSHQPMGEKSAGSIFKNPPGAKVWELITEAEMRGYQIGGAKVSEKHSNFIINTGGAKAEHIVMLIAMIKQRVRVRFGIQLQQEIECVGF